jgi:hypothetical protein
MAGKYSGQVVTLRMVFSLDLISLPVVRMTWWFIILGCSALVVVCVAIALFLRVRRHMGPAKPALRDDPVDHNTGSV